MALDAKKEIMGPSSGKRMGRREFFKRLCVLSGAVVLPAGVLSVGCSQGGGSSSANPTGGTTASTNLSKQSFENTIDTVFSVTHDTYGVIDLQLNLVADEMIIPEAEQFSITLSGPVTPVLSEDSYGVYNDNLGSFDLYIQPGGVSNGQQQYVAVFSLLNA